MHYHDTGGNDMQNNVTISPIHPPIQATRLEQACKCLGAVINTVVMTTDAGQVCRSQFHVNIHETVAQPYSKLGVERVNDYTLSTVHRQITNITTMCKI
jgi:hypothetical protein